MQKMEKRYREALHNIPAPGGGGCHAALLGVASLGIMAGYDDSAILADIRAAIPPGRRRVSDTEIRDAIQRAHVDTVPFTTGCISQHPRRSPRRNPAKDEKSAADIRSYLLEAGGGSYDPFGPDLWESSPIRIDAYAEKYPYIGDMVLLLRTLWREDEILFIGERKSGRRNDLKTVAEWIAFFENYCKKVDSMTPEQRQHSFEYMGAHYPHIIPNPLTGQRGLTKGGVKNSWRADSCVRAYRYIVVEFDNMEFTEQGAIIRGIEKSGAEIAAVIYSGSKSCHAWLRCIGINSGDEWERQVKQELFPILAAAGVDKANSNPARLSRLPGVLRSGGGWQQLLYLNPGRI